MNDLKSIVENILIEFESSTKPTITSIYSIYDLQRNKYIVQNEPNILKAFKEAIRYYNSIDGGNVHMNTWVNTYDMNIELGVSELGYELRREDTIN